jgi:phosphoglycerol transferase MdoB-like AlkP superfamily enzyme
MIYAPKKLAPRQVDTLTTQIDIAPTVLGLLGLPYEAPFFGVDVLHTSPEHRIALFSHNHDVAIYRDGELMVMRLGKTSQAYRYDRKLGTFTVEPDVQNLLPLGIAYFQTAADLFKSHSYE